MAENKVKTIGILTSGGDAPGMNAAIRACVRKEFRTALQSRELSVDIRVCCRKKS